MIRARGATVTEVVIALGVVLIGLVALFGALAARLVGGATAARMAQAQLAAAGVIESVRRAPAAALDCLAGAPGGGWARCEEACRRERGPAAAPGACAFAAARPYALVFDPTAPLAPDGATRTSQVARRGRLYDVQITVGWDDDAAARPRHFVTLRSAVFR